MIQGLPLHSFLSQELFHLSSTCSFCQRLFRPYCPMCFNCRPYFVSNLILCPNFFFLAKRNEITTTYFHNPTFPDKIFGWIESLIIYQWQKVNCVCERELRTGGPRNLRTFYLRLCFFTLSKLL